MNINIRSHLFILFIFIFIQGHAQKTYSLISRKTGKLNSLLASSLPPELKALAAFYSAMGGTDCMDEKCALTSALGLGNQGSDAQKKIILKYFPDDKAARLVISQDCYLPPATAASYSNFKYLSISVNADLVQVDYELDVFSHGNIKKIKGPDIYAYKNQVYKNKKRVLYAWTNK